MSDLVLRELADLLGEDGATGSWCKLNTLTFLSFKGDAGLEMDIQEMTKVFFCRE